MTPYQLFTVFRARWKAALGIFVLTVAVVLAITLVLPKQYAAKATVLIDVKSPDPIAGMVLPAMLSPSYMATQIDIIKSERVTSKVIAALQLDKVPALKEQWSDETGGEGVFQSWLAELLQKKLDVQPSRESSVINIEYESVDPNFAAALANAFVKAYIEASLELRVDPARQYSQLFGSQAAELRKKLEAAQASLSEYQKQNGIIATDERLDIETTRLNELSSQLVALQSMAAESSSRSRTASANSSEVLLNPVVSSLNAELVRQEARLKEYGSKLGPAHPQVLELKENTAELRSRMNTEIARVKSSLGISDNINNSRVGQVKAALEAQRQALLKMKTQRDEAFVLLKDVQSAQNALDAVQARFNQTDLERQSTQTNVAVLQQATPPTEKSWPKTWLNLALAVVGASALAFAVVIGVELSDRKIRSAQDITCELDVPVLAILRSIDVGATGKSNSSEIIGKRIGAGPASAKRLTAA